MTDSQPYNPLDKLNLGKSVADAFLIQPVRPLSSLDELIGAGVYAIYYAGNFEPYAPISLINVNNKFPQPIYVGKAIPKGSRKGGISKDAAKGTALRDRLRNHANSINEAENIELSHFYCRTLTVDDVWIPLGESMLIGRFQPIWNVMIDGFGNNVPGAGRPQKKSLWDVLHPGRKLTRNLTDNKTTADMIIDRLSKYFVGIEVPPPPLEEISDDDIEND